MKRIIVTVLLLFGFLIPAKAQIRQALQLSTLAPTFYVLSNNDIENYKKHHYTVSTILYLGNYMIMDSIWKAATVTLLMGITKELIYDGLLGKGEMLFVDMKWNSLGIIQGTVFTVSLKF